MSWSQPTEKEINRARTMLGAGASIEDIHDALSNDGLCDDDIYLTIKAAELLLSHSEES